MRDIFGSDEEDEERIELRNSFLYEVEAVGGPMLDIRKDAVSGPFTETEELHSEEAKVLEEIYKALGNEKVTHKRMECAPPWIVKKAVDEEL